MKGVSVKRQHPEIFRAALTFPDFGLILPHTDRETKGKVVTGQ